MYLLVNNWMSFSLTFPRSLISSMVNFISRALRSGSIEVWRDFRLYLFQDSLNYVTVGVINVGWRKSDRNISVSFYSTVKEWNRLLYLIDDSFDHFWIWIAFQILRNTIAIVDVVRSRKFLKQYLVNLCYNKCIIVIRT
jgi:hypothetical protein